MRFLTKSLVGCFLLLPQGVAIQLGRLIGWLLRNILHFRHQVVEGQMKMVYGHRKSPEEISRLVRLQYQHLGLLLMEMLRLPGISRRKHPLPLRLSGMENVDAALAKGKGVIIVSGHIGNWELGGITLANSGYKVYAIGKEMKSEAGEIMKQMIRDDNGLLTIARRNSLRQILRALKDNSVLIIVIDQNMTVRDGIFVDFFGQAACTMTAAAVLAERTGAAVLTGSTWRTDDLLHHEGMILPELRITDAPEQHEAKIHHLTQAYSKALESLIDQHPEQWLWLHKRWKTRPPDETEPPIRY